MIGPEFPSVSTFPFRINEVEGHSTGSTGPGRGGVGSSEILRRLRLTSSFLRRPDLGGGVRCVGPLPGTMSIIM